MSFLWLLLAFLEESLVFGSLLSRFPSLVLLVAYRAYSICEFHRIWKRRSQDFFGTSCLLPLGACVSAACGPSASEALSGFQRLSHLVLGLSAFYISVFKPLMLSCKF